MTETYLFTPAGYNRLLRRIKDAREAYNEVCKDNPAAREAGDSSVWHDNFAFEENQRLMHQLAHRVRDLERIMDRAEVIEPAREAPPKAVFGALVKYIVDDGKERTAFISGYDDGAPENGRISYNSPLGRRLLGAAPGDELELKIGPRTMLIEVIAIEPAPEEEFEALEDEG